MPAYPCRGCNRSRALQEGGRLLNVPSRRLGKVKLGYFPNRRAQPALASFLAEKGGFPRCGEGLKKNQAALPRTTRPWQQGFLPLWEGPGKTGATGTLQAERSDLTAGPRRGPERSRTSLPKGHVIGSAERPFCAGGAKVLLPRNAQVPPAGRGARKNGWWDGLSESSRPQGKVLQRSPVTVPGWRNVRLAEARGRPGGLPASSRVPQASVRQESLVFPVLFARVHLPACAT